MSRLGSSNRAKTMYIAPLRQVLSWSATDMASRSRSSSRSRTAASRDSSMTTARAAAATEEASILEVEEVARRTAPQNSCAQTWKRLKLASGDPARRPAEAERQAGTAGMASGRWGHKGAGALRMRAQPLGPYILGAGALMLRAQPARSHHVLLVAPGPRMRAGNLGTQNRRDSRNARSGAAAANLEGSLESGEGGWGRSMGGVAGMGGGGPRPSHKQGSKSPQYTPIYMHPMTTTGHWIIGPTIGHDRPLDHWTDH